MKKENKFQSDLIKELKILFPNCHIIKQDQNQGLPDLLILYHNKWAMLECKRSYNSIKQPNQEYYIDYFNRLSFASFIYPENKEEVLYDLQRSFENRR